MLRWRLGRIVGAVGPSSAMILVTVSIAVIVGGLTSIPIFLQRSFPRFLIVLVVESGVLSIVVAQAVPNLFGGKCYNSCDGQIAILFLLIVPIAIVVALSAFVKALLLFDDRVRRRRSPDVPPS
jgi:hypothetical protein